MRGLKKLGGLRDKSKGPVHSMHIHPATNSKGGLGFVTTKLRHPPKGQAGPGMGFVGPPPPEEAVHEDNKDMVNHVGRTFGVPDDGDQDDDEDDE